MFRSNLELLPTEKWAIKNLFQFFFVFNNLEKNPLEIQKKPHLSWSKHDCVRFRLSSRITSAICWKCGFLFKRRKKVLTKSKLTHVVIMCMCVGILPHLCADSIDWPTSESDGRSLNATHDHWKRIVWLCVEEREPNLVFDWLSSVCVFFCSFFVLKPKSKNNCNSSLL